jgi:3-(3-hydroxy-phenyl)propionate hydroxylase
MTSDSLPIVIVGAGPVGLTAALLLARRGARCVVLERHSSPYTLPRAVHIDGEVARILQSVGLSGGFGAISRAMPGLRLVDGELRLIAEFLRGDLVGVNGHPEASIFDQPDLERLLLDAVASQPEITVIRGAAVTGVTQDATGAHVRYERGGDETWLRASAVLGCDGSGSTVRAALDVRWRDLGFAEPWLVVDIRSPVPLSMWDGVHQVCDPRRAATFMHKTGDAYRWEFRILDSDDASELATPAGVAGLLRPWLGDTSLASTTIVRVATYVFHARVAQRWRDRRVFLLGDAAHQTPPFVGQGLGAGLRDAFNLAWKLDMVLRGEAPETLLDTYHRERAPHVVRTIRTAILVGWALTGGSGPMANARRRVVAGLSRIPAVPRAALRASSPRLRLDGSHWRSAPAPVGGLCPQPRDGEGWFDDRLGRGFTLLALHAADHTSPDIRVVVLEETSPLGRWIRGWNLCAILLRPDRVICATARSVADIRHTLDRVNHLQL